MATSPFGNPKTPRIDAGPGNARHAHAPVRRAIPGLRRLSPNGTFPEFAPIRRPMKRKNPKVDAFIRSASAWRKETEALRAICLGCGLNEEFKWSKPCYTFGESNVVLIQGFNEFCALLFCKGVLLKDPEGILRRIGEHTQAARQARFTDVRDITALKPALEASILEAIEVEKSGQKVIFRKNPEPVPAEFQKALQQSAALKAAFGALMPGRQRGYILHISSAKQSSTRVLRVEKCRERILLGKGLND